MFVGIIGSGNSLYYAQRSFLYYVLVSGDAAVPMVVFGHQKQDLVVLGKAIEILWCWVMACLLIDDKIGRHTFMRWHIFFESDSQYITSF